MIGNFNFLQNIVSFGMIDTNLKEKLNQEWMEKNQKLIEKNQPDNIVFNMGRKAVELQDLITNTGETLTGHNQWETNQNVIFKQFDQGLLQLIFYDNNLNLVTQILFQNKECILTTNEIINNKVIVRINMMGDKILENSYLVIPGDLPKNISVGVIEEILILDKAIPLIQIKKEHFASKKPLHKKETKSTDLTVLEVPLKTEIEEKNKLIQLFKALWEKPFGKVLIIGFLATALGVTGLVIYKKTKKQQTPEIIQD